MNSKLKILKPILSYWMALLLISLLAMQAVAASAKSSVSLNEPIPEEVQKVAEGDLQMVGNSLLQDTENSQLADAGITVRDMALGPGFKVNVITADQIKGSSDKTLSAAVTSVSPAVEWLFVLEAKQTQVALMEFDYEDQKYTLSGYQETDDTFLATANRLIEKFGKENVALLKVQYDYFFAYQDQDEIKVLAVDEETQEDLESYTASKQENKEPTWKTFVTAFNTSCSYRQKLQEESSEQLYGDKALYSAEETTYTASEKSFVGLWIGIATLIVVAVGGTVGIVFAVRKKKGIAKQL